MSINLISNVQFPSPFTPFDNSTNAGDQPSTLIDLRMNDLSYALRNKPSWWTEFKDPRIRAQWAEEALQQTIRGGNLSEREVEAVLDELEDYAKMRADPTGILSDKLVSEELNAKLLNAVSFLENVPDAEKDWRAGSNGVVLDLVDPDLFYAVNGRTLRWTTGPDGKWALERLTGISLDRNLGKLSYSTKFSQIPTEFQIGSNGEPAKALGYINNVHPEHGRDLVTVIEALVGRFSILWDRVLTDLHPLNALGGRKTFAQRDNSYSTQGKKLQVCVRLSGIHLTPENPEFPGGPWSVVGRANERIVAAGVHFYDSDNVTEPEVEFRRPVSLGPSVRQQNDAQSIKLTWGLEEGEGSNQVIGAMKAPTGRSVAFPNTYQFKYSSSKLVDPTKPGYRKLIAFFLVDPENHIPSTTDIPPQQAHWPQGEGEATLGNSMTLEEAKNYREQMMNDQPGFSRALNEQHFETKLSL
ncbi:hypothetical protein FRC04_007031 [Tulasnella sp. 424]|nr:hypothetical protein FRC04_007031 [Tulasnella sp. 424]